MAKKSLPKLCTGRRAIAERPVTEAQRSRAIAYLQKNGGAIVGAPPNGLVGDEPAVTIQRCKQIISFFAHIEEPFHGEELEAAKADILNGVADALDHAERTLRRYGSAHDPLAVRQEVQS